MDSPQYRSRARKIISALVRETSAPIPEEWGLIPRPASMTSELTERVMQEIVMPTVRGMAERKTPFRGILFAGLMITEAGPKLIEYNVRFGDPEAEVILARFTGDLLPFLEASVKGRLGAAAPVFRPDAALAVVLAARGYPGASLRGTKIRGIKDAERLTGVSVLHAGTRRERQRNSVRRWTCANNHVIGPHRH